MHAPEMPKFPSVPKGMPLPLEALKKMQADVAISLEREYTGYFTTFLLFRLFVNAYHGQPEAVYREHLEKLLDGWEAQMRSAVDAESVKMPKEARERWVAERHKAIHDVGNWSWAMLLGLAGYQEKEVKT